ncbi:MAG: substrate-binding domain-containing protein [Clostridiales bacterium]|jgi:ribose transport system substrate-binding protein|nr:substrate-binding domain-containing protein [Clostridiales bacterium]
MGAKRFVQAAILFPGKIAMWSILLPIILCSCSKPQSLAPPPEQNFAQGKHEYTIGIASSWGETEYAAQVYNDILKYAKNYPMFEIKYSNTYMNNQSQIEQINDWLNIGLDLLIVVPGDSRALNNTINKTMHDGIPVILLGANINGDGYSQYIGVDYYQLGSSVGKYISQHFLQRGGTVLEVQGPSGSLISSNIHGGLKNELGSSLISQIANWDADSAKQIADKVFEGGQEIDLVVGHNDELTYGFLEAAKQKGKDGIIYISAGGLGEPTLGQGHIEDKSFAFAVKIPTGVKEAFDSAYGILVDGDIQKNIFLSPEFITAE